MRTKLKLLFVCAVMLLLNVTPVAFGLVVGFNPDIHMDIQGVVANDFHVQGRLESGNFGGNWSNPPVLISHIDGGFTNFKCSITPDLADPNQNWYNFTADWSGTDYAYCSIIHLGLFFDVTCNNVAVNLVGWWTKDGLPIPPNIVPPPVNGGAVLIPGFNVQDMPRNSLKTMGVEPTPWQWIRLFNDSHLFDGGGGGGIYAQVVQMDVVGLTKEELETYLGPIPEAFEELRLGGAQEGLPWVVVENEMGPISETNPQPLLPDSFFDVFLDLSGPIHPVTPITIPPGGFLVARELAKYTNNNGQIDYRWDWMIHMAHESDLGDAPDSTNSFGMPPPLVPMTAYPKGGPMGVQANFPTVYQIGSPPYGPIHWAAPLIAFLGPMVSSETEADIGPDADGVNNIIPLQDTPDLDNFDDGVQVPLVLPNCQWTTFDYLVTIMPPMPPPMPQTPTLYVNVWFDWNRDGDWDDTMQCAGDDVLIPAPEWAVQNQVLVGLPVGLNKITTPPFMPWHPATGDMQPIWMRITLSEQKWVPTAGVLGNGGSGPQYGYLYGETEDYYFVPEVPSPQPKPLVEHSKWSQPPVEMNPQTMPVMYWGWNEPSYSVKPNLKPVLKWKIVADDFRCIGSMPITSIHWWGSYVGWQEQDPPAVRPTSWRIGFWSNVLPPAGGGGFSYPGKLLWQIEVPASRISEEWAGIDQFLDTIPDTCFQYNVTLNANEYFQQDKYVAQTQNDVFWISIVAMYPGVIPQLSNPWGWKTRPAHWMDDAVSFTLNLSDIPVGYVVDPQLITPLEINVESYDAAFELNTDPNYIKWEQTYTGIRDWPHYEDEMSMATMETTVEPITKWYQKPDTYETGIDVDAYEDIWRPQILADDFRCTTTGYITDIHIWGSWYHDHAPFGDPTQVIFTLSLHADIPANDPRYHNPYSMPGQVLWTKTFQPGQFDVTQYATTKEGWFVPCSEPQYYDPFADTICYYYSFFINPTEAFQQQGSPTKPVIYWLDVQAQPMHEPGFPEPIRFGWKDSTTHYQDNAVYAVGQEPIGVPGPWQPMWYPPGHPYQGQKIDLAFAITTNMTFKYYQEPDLQPDVSIDIDATKDQVWQPQVLADDFPCTSTDPITDIHIWGSWYHDMIPYGDPNKVIFKLSIRADIPAKESPTGYSMPGTVLWEREFQPGEFKATLYADNLYEGYLVPCSEPPYYEPYGDSMCWQYDFVIDPCEAFVQQGSTTKPVVYWLSAQARQVRPAAGEPIFPMRSRFGWKTTPIEYHWNDDAVWSKDGGVTWKELRYPSEHPYMGMSADLAFEITSQKTHQEFVIHRQVADDWRCQGRTPITAAVWWGSYIDYRYEPYQGVQQGQPTKPDYFLLSIWDDVPAATVAAGSSNGVVYVYDTAGNLLWSFNTGANVASVDVSSDGAYIAVGSQGNKLYLFARDGTKLWEKSVPIAYGGWGVGQESKSVAISAYGEYVVAGCTDKLYVYKKDGTLHYSNTGQETCVEISPNGNYIASCNNADGTIHLFSNTATGCSLLWTKTISNALCIATSDSGYVAVSDRAKVYLYDSAGTQIWGYTHAKWDSDIIKVDMPQDGLSVVAANDDPGDNKGCVLCYWNHLKDGTSGWSATDSTPVWTYAPAGVGSDYYSVAISGNGSYITTGGTQGPCLFASTSNVPLQTYGMGTNQSLDLTDTGFGVCGDSQGNLYYFSKDSNIPLWNKALGGNVHAVAVSRSSDQFSHPGTKKWEYKAASYDEVLVGYDKHPEPCEPGTGGFEPVFRYSVKLPDPNWFRQKDVNNVFWFSAVAVYDVNRPDYNWGWTNHKHVFNDDAVAGYQSPTGEWMWEELYDQTGESEDMSFILFTEPGCFPSTYTTYFDWLTLGKPNCWCGVYGNPKWPYQCDGDADGAEEGTIIKYRVYSKDLGAVIASWKKAVTDPAFNPCADLDHKAEGTIIKYRVYSKDLGIVIAKWKKTSAQLPANCPRAE